MEADKIDKFLIIDIETGEYEIDSVDRVASDRAHRKHPNGALYDIRILA